MLLFRDCPGDLSSPEKTTRDGWLSWSMCVISKKEKTDKEKIKQTRWDMEIRKLIVFFFWLLNVKLCHKP